MDCLVGGTHYYACHPEEFRAILSFQRFYALWGQRDWIPNTRAWGVKSQWVGETLFVRLFFLSPPSCRKAFFRFRIPDHGVSELFLFAGVVVEPDVTIDRTRVDFGALILRASLKETFHIVNREPMSHSFVLDKNSLGGAQVMYT